MSGRLLLFGRGIGMAAGGISAALWVSILWFPIGDFMLRGYGVAIGVSMATVALFVAIAAYHGHAAVIFFGFVISFFGIGTFSLNVDHWFRVFGILDLLMLLSSAMIWFALRQTKDEQ